MDVRDNTCLVCHEIVSVFAIGQCDHPICYKCSTRMRVLCEQMYCAICRSDLPEVLFVKKLNKYANINRRSFIPHKRYKIFFQDFDCEETFKKLQEHRCKICKDRPAEKTFYALKDHMRREHTLFCCDLCLLHLKIFSFERKFYNRRDLAIHRRSGDEDDKSYKGHPLCRFCDERYMDNDELLRHLRKDHYFCHFCDEGSNEYYNDYEDLKQHFKTSHYLCEIEGCINVQFTNAFRSNIDLKAHVAKEHHQGMNKAQFKEARTLDVNFQLAPRVKGRARGLAGLTSDDYEDVSGRGQNQGRGYRGRGGYRGGHDSQRAREERMQLERAREASIQESLKATEKEMREIERKRREAQEKEERKMEEERLKNELESIERDFPSLMGAPSAPSIVPPNIGKVNKKQSKDNKSKPMSQKITAPGRLNSTEYPTLPGGNVNKSNSSGHKASKPTTDRDSPVQNGAQVSVTPSSNVQTVPQSVLDSMKRNEPVVPKRVPKKTSEDFPTLGGGSQRSRNDGSASLVSLGVWSAKSRKNELHLENSSSSVKQQPSVPTSLASLGLSLCDTLPYPSQAGKRDAIASAPASARLVLKNNNTKSKNSNNKKDIGGIEKAPPPKTRDKEPPVETKESEVEQSKKNKKKKKQKEQKTTELEKPKSAGSEKEAKPKKSKSSDPVAKMFSEQSDRDSGIESSSGSVDSATVPTIRPEELKKVIEIKSEMTLTSADIGLDTVPQTYTCGGAGATSASLDCIAVGLLGEAAGASSAQKIPVLDDFPTLNAASSVAPPPGFKPAAPPGFGSKSTGSRPPPGFSSLSSGQETKSKSSPLSAEYGNFVFSKPTYFSERNKELVQNVSILLGSDQEKFSQFKAYSGSFRQGSLDAKGYYVNCQELLGQENFDMIIPELIALLPDIDKQQDLLSVHKEALKGNSNPSVLRISGKSTKAPWSTVTEFKTCPTCRQVLLEGDFDAHVSEHGGLQDFPSLGSRGHHPGFMGQGSWIKAK